MLEFRVLVSTVLESLSISKCFVLENDVRQKGNLLFCYEEFTYIKNLLACHALTFFHINVHKKRMLNDIN